MPPIRALVYSDRPLRSAESAIGFARRLQRIQIAGLRNMGSCSIPTAPTNPTRKEQVGGHAANSMRKSTLGSGPRHHGNSHTVTAKQIPLARRDVGPAFRRQSDLFNVLADRCAATRGSPFSSLVQVSQPFLDEFTRATRVRSGCRWPRSGDHPNNVTKFTF